MGKKSSHRQMSIVMLIVIAAFALGFAVNAFYSKEPSIAKINRIIAPTEFEPFEISSEGFVPVNVSIFGPRITLQSGCHAISFDVTSDQAFSIQHGIAGTTSVRPLTHDVLRDLIENFNITILSMRIERFGDDIYYARMFVQNADRVLDIDMRPSDAIALSLRTKTKLQINETMLEEKGTNIC